VHFGLVRLIHGEDSDSEGEEEGRGSSGCSEAGGAGHEEGRASPLRRGYVRVQWYPEGVKQHVKETKVPRAGRGAGLEVREAGSWLLASSAGRAVPAAVPLQWPRWEDGQPQQRVRSMQSHCTSLGAHASRAPLAWDRALGFPAWVGAGGDSQARLCCDVGLQLTDVERRPWGAPRV
jgi:hypothetical protein